MKQLPRNALVLLLVSAVSVGAAGLLRTVIFDDQTEGHAQYHAQQHAKRVARSILDELVADGRIAASGEELENFVDAGLGALVTMHKECQTTFQRGDQELEQMVLENYKEADVLSLYEMLEEGNIKEMRTLWLKYPSGEIPLVVDADHWEDYYPKSEFGHDPRALFKDALLALWNQSGAGR